MKGENGIPETPDWIPERRDQEALTFTPPGMKMPALWEGDQA